MEKMLILLLIVLSQMTTVIGPQTPEPNPTPPPTEVQSEFEMLVRELSDATDNDAKLEQAGLVKDYLSRNFPQEIYFTLDVNGTLYKIVWSPEWRKSGGGAWRWIEELEKEGKNIDELGETLIDPIIEAYTKDSGELVAIHPETGEEIVLEDIFAPGIGSVNLIEAYERIDEIMEPLYAEMKAALQRHGRYETEQITKIMDYVKERCFPLPVYILERTSENSDKSVYYGLTNAGGGGLPANESIAITPQPMILSFIPVYEKNEDSGEKALVAVKPIYLGIQSNIGTFYSSGESGLKFDRVNKGSKNVFGEGRSRTGFVFLGNTTKDTFEGRGVASFMENGANVINELELQELIEAMASGDMELVEQILSENPMAVGFPRYGVQFNQ